MSPDGFFGKAVYFRVFELPFPRNAQKRDGKNHWKKKLFLGAAANVGHFRRVFFTPPLEKR
jgi:hypothetical protein